jgi:hypothetical protein
MTTTTITIFSAVMIQGAKMMVSSIERSETQDGAVSRKQRVFVITSLWEIWFGM